MIKKSVVFVLLLLVVVNDRVKVNGLNCYVCGSLSSNGCNDPFDKKSTSVTTVDDAKQVACVVSKLNFIQYESFALNL
jgi:hypothetical protein